MEKVQGVPGSQGVPQKLIARVALVIAAIGIISAFFLPWGSAGAEWREAAAQAPDVMFYEPTGLTVSDAADLSLLEYAQVYGLMGDTVWVMYAYIVYAGIAFGAVAVVLAALARPVGAAVPGALAFAISRLLVWDFGDRGVLPNSTHDWGAAPTIFVIAAVALVVAAVWLFMIKRREKHAGEL